MVTEAKTTVVAITANVADIRTTRRKTELVLKNVSINIKEGENEKIPLKVANIKENGSQTITFFLGTLDAKGLRHMYRVVKPPMRYPRKPCSTCRIQILFNVAPWGEMIETIMILNPATILASNIMFNQGFVNRFFEEIAAEVKRRLEGNPYAVQQHFTERGITPIP